MLQTRVSATEKCPSTGHDVFARWKQAVHQLRVRFEPCLPVKALVLSLQVWKTYKLGCRSSLHSKIKHFATSWSLLEAKCSQCSNCTTYSVWNGSKPAFIISVTATASTESSRSVKAAKLVVKVKGLSLFSITRSLTYGTYLGIVGQEWPKLMEPESPLIGKSADKIVMKGDSHSPAVGS